MGGQRMRLRLNVISLSIKLAAGAKQSRSSIPPRPRDTARSNLADHSETIVGTSHLYFDTRSRPRNKFSRTATMPRVLSGPHEPRAP
jgi:hypothetical protein